jgi:chromosome segregation protein
MLFTHLFGGGEANLVLVESDDPLEAGLEIMCQPPGKKLSTLSLLSGGEQTLTALALIFAVFLANPAPICVLDEVDAPLDDANVGRFCDLLDEMTRRTETRFLIITHHAVTMSADGPAVRRDDGRAGREPAGRLPIVCPSLKRWLAMAQTLDTRPGD